MKTFIDKLALFLIAIVVSITLHVALVAWLSGIHGFEFINAFRDRTIIVDLGPTYEQKFKTIKQSLSATKRATKPVIKQDTVTLPVKEEQQDIKPPEDSLVADDTTESEELAEDESPDAEAETDTSPTVQLLKHARETFRYNISWIGVLVGKAVLKASNEKGVITITSQVDSTPFISTFYRVEDHAKSTVINGIPTSFRIRQQEGKYRSDKETIFDTENRKITFINYLKNTKDEHAVEGVLPWDVISGFYYFRTQALELDKTDYIDVFDSNKFFKAEITALRNEKATSPATGEVDTIVVQLVLKSEGLFQSTGNILIWLTNDDRKIPVRIEAKAPVGHVAAELTVIETEK